MKRSVILTDRLGPDILLVLTMKRQVLHRERAHLKVPGCSLVLSALLTKKLPTFLSRLNEISGGLSKIGGLLASVSSVSFPHFRAASLRKIVSNSSVEQELLLGRLNLTKWSYYGETLKKKKPKTK